MDLPKRCTFETRRPFHLATKQAETTGEKGKSFISRRDAILAKSLPVTYTLIYIYIYRVRAKGTENRKNKAKTQK